MDISGIPIYFCRAFGGNILDICGRLCEDAIFMHDLCAGLHGGHLSIRYFVKLDVQRKPGCDGICAAAATWDNTGSLRDEIPETI